MGKTGLIDQVDRDRFSAEGDRNFAVSANAGSGKTTAISHRLAVLARRSDGATLLQKTAVVTYTKKAANQIAQRARGVLMQSLLETNQTDLAPLDNLERAYFGTIHSFCLKLAQSYGQDLGVNLNPTVLNDEDEAAFWEEFLEQDEMQFFSVTNAEVTAFLRHVPLAAVFDLARTLDAAATHRFLRSKLGLPVGPDERVLDEILAVESKRSAAAVTANQTLAKEWLRRFQEENDFLPLAKPQGTAAGMPALFDRFYQPLKMWLSEVAALLAAELADRYRHWRFDRGVQTYDDQIDAALEVLHHQPTLDRIRKEGWRVILDEAQDTDPSQFAVLVEVARVPGASIGTWPGKGEGPRAGHFCMVGDGQQSIYSSRADIGNFMRHLEAFERRDGGELLKFQVTFRAPRQVVNLLNETLPDAFGMERDFNQGLPPEEGAPAPCLQVPYVPLEPGPDNVEGSVSRLILEVPAPAPKGVDAWLREEARQLAEYLKAHGPAGVGAATWGEVCILAPRNDWLLIARKEFEGAGLKVALQMRRNRNGDNPAFAWVTGLLAAVCDPDNTFEWVGVLREVFAVSDGLIAKELRSKGQFHWDAPEEHPQVLGEALQALRPFVLQANDEGVALEQFVTELGTACSLRAKIEAVDESGVAMAEWNRLLAQAATRGLEGMGPREWLGELLAEIDAGRPSGQPTADAINVLTSHSAKGLEWPVVIPLGLWRGLGKRSEIGFRMVSDREGGQRIYLDTASLPADTKLARNREWLREQVRLLYVTLTRARCALVLPWGKGFGGKPNGESLTGLWGVDLQMVSKLEAVVHTRAEEQVEELVPVEATPFVDGEISGWEALPERVLPHQLALEPDLVRGAKHESGAEGALPSKPGLDPIDYGLWWHETMEFLPWEADEVGLAKYGEDAIRSAKNQGFSIRGQEDWDRLMKSLVWKELSDPRWVRSAELSIFAPLKDKQWIDGVIDLVLHDNAADEVWVVDWKTNRRRLRESDEGLMARLCEEYAPQLSAYGQCMAELFPSCRIRKWLYASETGTCGEI